MTGRMLVERVAEWRGIRINGLLERRHRKMGADKNDRDTSGYRHGHPRNRDDHGLVSILGFQEGAEESTEHDLSPEV